MNQRPTLNCLLPLSLLTVLSFSNAAQAARKKCLNENKLGDLLITAVKGAEFEQVTDLGPNFTESPCPETEPACKHGRSALGVNKYPQVDLAVIAFQKDCPNKVVGGNVFFSRDFPRGIIAQFDKKSGQVRNVRLQRWTQERFDEGKVIKTSPYFEKNPEARKAQYPADDLINAEAAAASAPDFMSPYPASIFKMLVLTRVLQFLEEKGPLEAQLAQNYTYDFGTADTSDDVTLSLREFLDAMIQWSGNKATAAMIQFLHRNGQIVESEVKDQGGYPAAAPSVNTLNRTFAEIGLQSLQMNRTRAKDGLWGNRDTMYLKSSSSISHISMPSWDVARLLWLMRTQKTTPPAERPAWTLPDGRTVDAFKISDGVKQLFWANMQNQLFHEVLSNTLHCRQAQGGEFGIPAILPSKWMNNGQLRLPAGSYPFTFAADELKGDYKFSPNIAECQKTAEVEFASKTGLTSVSGSHAGLVKGLSERGFNREYIVVLNSSLGSRFTDAERLDTDRIIPCFDKTQCYTKRISRLGSLIDNSLKEWLENDERKSTKSQYSGRKTKGR
ncbi:MAG: hypothetical protein EBR09_14105 [Proteobacteria bacterium]|nr:hypothetical protein [Pseudomonadota bacterium]